MLSHTQVPSVLRIQQISYFLIVDLKQAMLELGSTEFIT
jgi:hypothetical protein